MNNPDWPMVGALQTHPFERDTANVTLLEPDRDGLRTALLGKRVVGTFYEALPGEWRMCDTDRVRVVVRRHQGGARTC